jgi:hypothetical protein
MILKIQINLIFTLYQAHLDFLCWDLDNNRVTIFFKWAPWDPMRIPRKTSSTNVKKFWSSKTQRNLISALRRVHLYLLCWDLDDNRVKNFFKWVPWDPMGIPGETSGTNVKKLWSSKTQINLIFAIRHASLYFLHWDPDSKQIFIWPQLFSNVSIGINWYPQYTIDKNLGP